MSIFLVVSYDVKDDRRRVRIASELENFGERVQRSVFECHLEEEQIQELQDRIEREVCMDEDNVRYYRLCPKDLQRVLVDGAGAITRDLDYYVL